MIFAGVIVITTTGLFEITKKLYAKHATDADSLKGQDKSESGPKSRRIGSLIFFSLLTTLAFALVFILGWWRGEEMIYAASVQTGAWKDFLTNNPTLTRVVVVLLTTALPVFVAMSFEWGLDGLHLAWEWRKSRAVYRRFASRLAKSLTNVVAWQASRHPTSQQGISFVSASIAVQVQTSPNPHSPL